MIPIPTYNDAETTPGSPGGSDAASLNGVVGDLAPSGGPSKYALPKFLEPPIHGCPLRRANHAGKEATRDAIRFRCGRLSCPDCIAFKIRDRVRAAQDVAAEWAFPRVGLTLACDPVAVADLSPSYLQARYHEFAGLGAVLENHPDVAAYLLKLEVDQAKQLAPGVPGTVVHAHLDLMTQCHNPKAVLDQCLPPGLWDTKLSPDPDAGWIGYLGKGTVPQFIATGRNPKVLLAIGRKLDRWEAVAGHRRSFWFGGMYHLGTRNGTARGAGIAKALADPDNWHGLDGALRLSQARRWAKRLQSVRKHSKYAPFYRGTCRLDGPVGPCGRFVAREVPSG